MYALLFKFWKKDSLYVLTHFRTGEESACSGLATFEEDVATIGEDGRINLLSTRQEDSVRIYGSHKKKTIYFF